MGSTAQGGAFRIGGGALDSAAAGFENRARRGGSIQCTRREISAKGYRVGRRLIDVRLSTTGNIFGNRRGVAVAVRRQHPAAQGLATGPPDPALAGRNHDAKESHADTRGKAFRRLRPGSHKAVGKYAQSRWRAGTLVRACRLWVTLDKTQGEQKEPACLPNSGHSSGLRFAPLRAKRRHVRCS
jgi:hypothetical protein